MTTPRPDQRVIPAPAGVPGSRSGAGDIAGALGYPGVPPGVTNIRSAQALRRSISGAGVFFTFTGPARIWTVLLSYAVASFTSFTPPVFFAATITTGNALLPLAVVELSLASVPDRAWGVCPVPYNGLPVTQGDSLFLNINGGTIVPGASQEASAVVLYSIP